MFQKDPVYKVQAASLFKVSNRKAAVKYFFSSHVFGINYKDSNPDPPQHF